MNKRCRAFPSEYLYEFTEKRYAKREPYIPIEHWDDSDKKDNLQSWNKSTEELISKFILERLQTVYRLNYKDRSGKQEEEEIDLGNELINYLKNLYYNENADKPARLLYTSSRLFGYASPQDLSLPLSNYQDTYGRTGGHVMLKNVRKMLATKRRQMIRSKLQANAERESTLVLPHNEKSFSKIN